MCNKPFRFFERINYCCTGTKACFLKTPFRLSLITACLLLIATLLLQSNLWTYNSNAPDEQLTRISTANGYSNKTSILMDELVHTLEQDIGWRSKINDLNEKPDNEIKIILHWNNWNPSMGYEPLVQGLCPVTACIFTPDRSLLNYSTVVLFSCDNETSTGIHPLPPHRQVHQRFVFVASQPPDYATRFFDRSNWLDFFNWTMTYRLDSDIVFRHAFGTVTPTINYHATSARHKKSRTKDHWMVRPSKRLRIISRIGNKKKLVAWFPSECHTSVRREEYITQLSQYVPIDVYGKCGNLTCNMDCFEMLRSEYKFYLAFEASWCPDYVTTEFYSALDYDAVPVVLGGADYDSLAPPNSFINVLDFPSMQSLADYLLFLDKTPEMYARYFDWKKQFDISPKPMSGWCDLCQLAHDSSLPPKVYRDMKNWWVDDAQCQNKTHLL